MISPGNIPIDYEKSGRDVRLMLTMRNGSSTAFEELVRKYERPVLLSVQQRTGNRHLAEDLRQEVFLRVFRARHSYKPTAKFSTWLAAIARNVAADAMRDQAQRRETALPPDESLDPLGKATYSSPDQSPAARLDRKELRTYVRSAVNGLCQRQRQAVVLQTCDAMKYDQIADMMDTSTKAVKSLLARARDHLRGELKPQVKRLDA